MGKEPDVRATVAWNDELVAASRTYWRCRRLVRRDPPSMAEPCAADNGGQSRRACSRLAAVYPASAIRHAVTQTEITVVSKISSVTVFLSQKLRNHVATMLEQIRVIKCAKYWIPI